MGAKWEPELSEMGDMDKHLEKTQGTLCRRCLRTGASTTPIPGTISFSAKLYRYPNLEGAVKNISGWRLTCLVLTTTHDSENVLRSKRVEGVCSEYVKSSYKSIKWWFFEENRQKS